MRLTKSSPTDESRSDYRLVLVEDRREVREHWAMLLNSLDGFVCTCACASGEEALVAIPRLHPDIVLMDIYMPAMSGIECTMRVKEELPPCRVIILTASNDEEMILPLSKPELMAIC